MYARPARYFTGTDCWFELISSKDGSLGSAAERALNVDGFVVFPGPVPREHLEELTQAYDNAFRSAEPPDVAIGSSTTRVSDFVNRDSIFDQLYLYGPLLEACCRIIQQPFKLSTMLARTLRPHGAAQKLHVDFASDKLGWPMVGFILMIDEFRPENGATCFVEVLKALRSCRQIRCLCRPVAGKRAGVRQSSRASL